MGNEEAKYMLLISISQLLRYIFYWNSVKFVDFVFKMSAWCQRCTSVLYLHSAIIWIKCMRKYWNEKCLFLLQSDVIKVTININHNIVLILFKTFLYSHFHLSTNSYRVHSRGLLLSQEHSFLLQAILCKLISFLFYSLICRWIRRTILHRFKAHLLSCFKNSIIFSILCYFVSWVFIMSCVFSILFYIFAQINSIMNSTILFIYIK